MEPPSPLFVLKKVGESITDLQFWEHSQRPQHLLSGYSNKGGIDIWNLQTRRAEAHHPSDSGVVAVHGNDIGEVVCLNKDGELMVLDCRDGRLMPKSLLTLSNVGFCRASCLTFGNETLAAVPGEETSSICVWNLKLKKLLWRLVPGEDSKLGMAMCVKLFGDDIKSLNVLAGYEDGSVILWDAPMEKQTCRLQVYDLQPVMCVDYDIASRSGIVGSPSEILTKLQLSTKNDQEIQVVKAKTREIRNSGIADVKIRPDRKIMATGGWDGNVRIFSWKTLKPLAVLQYHVGTVQALAFKPGTDSSQQILASGSADHKIAIWKVFN